MRTNGPQESIDTDVNYHISLPNLSTTDVYVSFVSEKIPCVLTLSTVRSNVIAARHAFQAHYYQQS
jgi:hypothetical protein